MVSPLGIACSVAEEPSEEVRIDPPAPPAESRAGRKDKRMMQTEFRAESLAMAQTIRAHAEKRGMTAGQFAVNVLAEEQQWAKLRMIVETAEEVWGR